MIQDFKNSPNKWYFVVGVIITGLVIFVPDMHDYLQYKDQWQAFLNGVNVYEEEVHPYGPLHNAMAYIYDLHPKLPRFLFAMLAFGSMVYLDKQVWKNDDFSLKQKKWLRVFLLVNPIMHVFFAVHGCNDGLVATALLAGVVLYDHRRFEWAAILIGVSVFYKFVPLFMIPFLCLHHGRINWRFTGSIIAVLVAGFGISYLQWGEAIVEPFNTGSARESKILSIFRFLRGDFSPLQWFGIHNVDYLSAPLIMAGLVVLFIRHAWLKLDGVMGSLLSMVLVFTLYAVGHFQIFFSLVILAVYVLSQYSRFLHHEARQAIFVFLGWIAFTTVLYAATEGYYRHFEVIREFVSVPTFVIMVYLFWKLVKIDNEASDAIRKARS